MKHEKHVQKRIIKSVDPVAQTPRPIPSQQPYTKFTSTTGLPINNTATFMKPNVTTNVNPATFNKSNIAMSARPATCSYTSHQLYCLNGLTSQIPIFILLIFLVQILTEPTTINLNPNQLTRKLTLLQSQQLNSQNQQPLLVNQKKVFQDYLFERKSCANYQFFLLSRKSKT